MNINFFLVGGGSGGHAVPLFSLIQYLKKNGVSCLNNSLDAPLKTNLNLIALGRKEGIERQLLEKEVNKYIEIPAAKLRRNLNVKTIIANIKDGFNLIKAFYLSYKKMKAIKKAGSKNILFSTGGFVALPPMIVAYFLKIPVFMHEQTTRIGLANYLGHFFAKLIFLSFDDSLKYYPAKKSIVMGYPLRDMFFRDGFFDVKPDNKKIVKKPSLKTILITGGGNGSKLINRWVKKNISNLVKKYKIIHQTGIAEFSDFQQVKETLATNRANYTPMSFFVGEEWVKNLSKADLIISRSGAGIVSECIFLNKKAIFIPLKIAQKNEQYHNARAAEREIPSLIIQEDELSTLSCSRISEFIKAKPDLPLTKPTRKRDIREDIVKKIFSLV